MKKIMTLLLSLSLLVSGCAFAEEANDVWKTVEDAYLYAFPLLLMDATKTLSTNCEEPVAGRAPINQFMHGRGTADASFRTVVTPNVDTVYSQVWLDLADEPLIFVMPAADRFFNVQLLDAWTNTVTVIEEPGVYAFVLKGWEGELPEGVTRIDFPTQMAWFIARCLYGGADDMSNVAAIQNQMVLLPLSAYVSGEEYTPAKGTYSEENEFVPVNKVLSMSPVEFFSKANELMLVNPPADADAEILAKIAEIGVGPGCTFDISVLTGDIAEQWKAMLGGLRTKLFAAGNNYTVKLGQWSYYGRPIGDFGTAYDYRAMVALGGLGANTLDVAMYTKTLTDSNGEVLTGEHTYIMHFDAMPPVLEKGFWSVTAYGNDDFLIDNPLNRYAINDRSDFVLNEDGSLDIIISASEPEQTSNWLPVSGDEFHLFLRIYLPDLDGIAAWASPTITVAD